MLWTITVECPRTRLKRKIWFQMMKYQMKRYGDEYTGMVTERQANKIKSLCSTYHLKYRINDDFSERSTDYRQTFFKNTKPIYKDIYLCSYCGRPVGKKRLTVDHLYPVGAVKKSIKLQKKLKRNGITNVNDIKNLVPACRHCNSKKSAKLGLWIIRGKIGRNQELWVVRHIIRLTFLFAVIIFLYTGKYTEYLRIDSLRNAIWNLKQLYSLSF